MFYPYEGYSSVTPLDTARVNRTIFHHNYKKICQAYSYIIYIRTGRSEQFKAMFCT